MADVTGSIGNEHVELNNAATEATLKLLLQATLAANRQSLASIQQLAQSSGLNPQTVAAANQGLQQTDTTGRKVGRTFEALGFAAGALSGVFKESVELSKKLASGTGEASDVLSSFAKIGGVTGVVIGVFRDLALAQEKYLQTYQTLSSAGINFGGSLTDMRMAASNVYTTLDGFANLMKNNSQAFAKMGNTADQGARAFLGAAERMQKSEIGQDLRALGYTSDQVNQGLASYISMTGGRNAQEMKNTSAITKAAGEYLTQLDALAVITGKTREEQEQALKRANANAAFEQMKLGMSEEQREAYNRGLAEMSAKFGKAGEDLYISQAMGVPPMTEAAQKLHALSPEVAKASQGMADVGKRGGSAAETMKLSAQATEGAVRAAKRFEGVAGALSFSTDSTSQGLMGLTGEANRARIQGAETAAAGEKQRAEIAAAQKKRRESEAKDAQSAQDALKELGNTILSAFMPIMKALFPIINSFIRGFAEVLGPLFKFASMLTANETVMSLLKVTVAGLVAALLAYKAYQLVANVYNGTSGILNRGKDAVQGAVQGFRTGGVRGAIGGLVGGAFGAGGLGKPDGSATNPYYVIVVSGPGGLLNSLPGAGGGLGGLGGGAGRAAGASRIGGALSSLGNLGAANIAKGAGVIGAVIGLATLAGSVSDIRDREKKGEITKEQAKTETGGAVGSAAGSAGGAFAGAAAGAALGSVVPVLGTAIGGVLGGVVGGLAGSSVGKSIGEWFSTSGKKESDKAREEAAEKRKIEEAELAKKKAEAESALKGPGIMQSLMFGSGSIASALSSLTSRSNKSAPGDSFLGNSSDKGLNEMQAKFGKAGADLFKSQVMGLPPMTEAAQKLAAMKNGSEIEEMQRQTSQAELENKPEKSPMEVMQTEIQMLNKNIAEMLKYTKDMTENTKRTMDGIGKLNPNLFAR